MGQQHQSIRHPVISGGDEFGTDAVFMFYGLYKLLFDYFSRMISSVRVFSIDFSSRCVTPRHLVTITSYRG